MSTTTDGDPDAPFTLNVDEPELTDPRLEAPVVPEKPATPEELKAQLDAANKIAADALVQRDKLMDGLSRRDSVQPAAAPPPVDDSAARAKYDAFMADIAQKQLAGDYDGANRSLLSLVDGLVSAKTREIQAPLGAGTARQALRNFTASMQNDDLYPRVKEIFTPMVESAMQGISQMDPAMQDKAIETLYDAAIGQAARAGKLNGRREEPPPYATGGPSGGARPGVVQKKLNAMQKEYVKGAREAGIPEDRIRQVLDEMDRVT